VRHQDICRIVEPPVRNFMVFPGGEPHISVSNTKEVEEITVRIKSFEDVGKLLVLTDALKRTGAKEIHVTIPYFPGARQDRVANWGEALTVKIYADIINAQEYSSVTIADPHSEVVVALLNNVRVRSLAWISAVQGLDRHIFKDTVLICPDAGAFKRVESLKRLTHLPMVQCTKHRDTKTGHLSSFVVHTDTLEGQKCVIVDDICDGGGTFLMLAPELRKKGAKKVSLFVTHGIFSKGLSHLYSAMDLIVTTNSFQADYPFNDPNLFQVINVFNQDTI
jgi:ribose-phosphate pyrophosphokinase